MQRLLLSAALLICSVASTATPAADDLETRLRPMIEAHDGEVAIVIRNLDTGEQFAWREAVVQPTASLIKLPVLVTAYRYAEAGRLDLQTLLEVQEADKVPGSGILTPHFSAGARISVRDAIRLMIRYSDNTATNLVVDQLGLSATTGEMTSLGYPETQLHAKVYRGDTSIAPERSQQYGLGSTTALDIVNLLSGIHEQTLAGPESCAAMLQHLLSCEDRGMLAQNLPDDVQFAHKTGAVGKSRCDAGLMLTADATIAVCVLTTNNKDQRWSDTNAAHVLMGRIGRAVYDHYFRAPQGTEAAASLVLEEGSFGEQVEDLQRTLNARLQPSPGLSVDGDFGPATAASVRRFQREQKLAETGVVGAEIWKVLGPVVAEAAVPSPQEVNSQVLTMSPADALSGAPFVSADAWTIVDAADGRELAGSNSEVPRDIASTTKMMTAWLVAQLADRSPEILQETLTMSRRADLTQGSTAGIRTGERLTVHEALYGLMLPSGNDMSVALAEHFGGRLIAGMKADANDSLSDAAIESEAPDSLIQFVEAMNAEAKRLGMTGTHYVNPHGLTEDNHLSTPLDLSRLAQRILGNELLRTVISTRQRGATVTGSTGYQRNVMWVNTNQLLGIEGFDGMKTGTTTKAGACLVSTGERDGRRLIVVVLGSAASEARYTDSRNLYRWAWSELVQR